VNVPSNLVLYIFFLHIIVAVYGFFLIYGTSHNKSDKKILLIVMILLKKMNAVFFSFAPLTRLQVARYPSVKSIKFTLYLFYALITHKQVLIYRISNRLFWSILSL
jgi:hypothetical protein